MLVRKGRPPFDLERIRICHSNAWRALGEAISGVQLPRKHQCNIRLEREFAERLEKTERLYAWWNYLWWPERRHTHCRDGGQW